MNPKEIQFLKSPVNRQQVIELIEKFATGGGGGTGTVTNVSVATANGFDATVANPTTTPEITLKTTITGIIKGDGTALEEAEAGVDYLTPTSTIDGGTF